MGIDAAVSHLEYEHERFSSQLRFARWLVARDTELKEAWDAGLAEAEAGISAAFDSGDLSAVRAAVRSAESDLAGLGEAAKRYTIYCAGHAHMDMNWMWSWPETVSATIDSITTVLRLLEEFPSFVFSQSQASIYRILEEYRPDLLDEVKRHVASGRWEITASHWVETDKNMVSGESLSRHLLYTRASMERLFGLTPEDVPIDWAPDTFGHAHTVPDYLARGAVRFVYLHRPGSDGDEERPGVFRWQGPGGSRVIVHNDMYHGYNGVIGPQIATSVLTARAEETGLPFTLFVYGVGDHGGGPTRADIAKAIDMTSWPLFPRIEFSTVRAYFERVESEATSLPLLDKELNFEFTGCYTTETLIKRANRFGEQRLLAAEYTASVASRLAGMDYPKTMLEEKWRDQLFSHFHDILPGSGVHDTRTYTHGLYQRIVAAAGSAETHASRLIAGLVDTSSASDGSADDHPRTMGAGAGRGSVDGGVSHYTCARSDRSQAVVVFNHSDIDRHEIVEAVVWDQGKAWANEDPGPFTVESPDGTRSPAQLLDGGGYWGHEYRCVAFPVSVPAFGYARYVVRHDRDAAAITEESNPHVRSTRDRGYESMQLGISNVCAYAAYERSPEGLENQHLRLELDPITGGIRRLVRKVDGAALIDLPDPAPLLSFGVERPGAMSAWQINHVMAVESPVLVSLRRVEDGRYAASLVAKYRVRSSEMTLTYRIMDSDPLLHVDIAGTWFERGGPDTGTPVLSLRLPTVLAGAKPTYDIPFGAIARDMPHGEEVPALSWAAVADSSGGLALVNDSKHGHAFSSGVLSLTLIRSSYDPDILPEIGNHSIRCALLGFSGLPDVADLSRRAAAFNRPLTVVSTDAHEGVLPPTGAFVTLDSEHAVISCVKSAERSDALVVRLYNPTDVDTTAVVGLGEQIGTVDSARLVDLMERPLGDDGVSIDGGRASLAIPAHGIASMMIEVAGK